ncbi:MAG: TIGR04086 family membrane protein [Clostridium sp.]
MENMYEKDKLYITYIKAIIGAGVLSIILLVIASLMFYFMKFTDSQMNTAVWVITVLGICFAGIFGAIKIGSKGYLHGAILGVIYTIMVGVIGMLTEFGKVNMQAFIVTIGMSIIVGMLSGMIGVTIKK